MSRKKMKIIAIEGIDKSGKHTQANLLYDHFRSLGKTVVLLDFPDYNSPFGQMIKEWLTNKWDASKEVLELLMTADKQAWQANLERMEKAGVDVVIIDRYTLSQSAYALASGNDFMWTAQLQKYLRKPDVNVFIDIPVEVSIARKGKHNDGNNDRYEEDKEVLELARQYFTRHADIHIDGEQSVEEIHKEIISKLNRKQKHPLVLIYGSSGVGKSSLSNMLEEWGISKEVVSYTTRKQRRNESKTAYHFITQEEYDRILTSEDGFVQVTLYDDNHYGILKSELDYALSESVSHIVTTEKGVEQYLRAGYDCIIFHLVASEELCRQRLITRGDHPSRVAHRLQADQHREKLTYEGIVELQGMLPTAALALEVANILEGRKTE